MTSPRRKEPLTDAEREVFASGMLLKELGARFGCSETVGSNTRRAVLAGEQVVYLYKIRTARVDKGKRRQWREETYERLDNPLGLDPAEACNAHLEDLRRVYGTRVRG